MRVIYLICTLILVSLTSLDAKDDKRWLIEEDFNNDGVVDRAISEKLENFGKSGGHFTIYLKLKGKFKKLGEVYLHPAAYCIEGRHEESRIWTYLIISAGAGLLRAYTIKKGKLNEAGSIEINPGDGGTELGRAIYKTIFRRKDHIKPKLVDMGKK